MAQASWIYSFSVTDLWGYRDISFTLDERVNIIIGPNASGKTTVLNLVRYFLSSDFKRLFDISFGILDLHFQEFASDTTHRLTLTRGEDESEIVLDDLRAFVSNAILVRELDHIPPTIRRDKFREYEKIRKRALELVPAVWLPISRRLPEVTPEFDESYYMGRGRTNVESVDSRLTELLRELEVYKLRLDTRLSDRYRVFQKDVLRVSLYNERFDQLVLQELPAPRVEEEEQMVKAFKAVGLFDAEIEAQIHEHFEAARKAIERLNEFQQSREGREFDINSLLVLPLWLRTRTMIDTSRSLESDERKIFETLRRYEELATDFLKPKSVSVGTKGDLVIGQPMHQGRPLEWRHLSSGEKQILIFLTQALTASENPVVYIADEPELSLHVSWQERLLSALQALAGEAQFIVATHSPDIVSDYADSVIRLPFEE